MDVLLYLVCMHFVENFCVYVEEGEWSVVSFSSSFSFSFLFPFLFLIFFFSFFVSLSFFFVSLLGSTTGFVTGYDIETVLKKSFD